jgi:ABC-type sugar transport system substrate-binding protein
LRKAVLVLLAVITVMSSTVLYAGEMNPMVKESIDGIMSQLGEMPNLHGGEKIGVLCITLANPYWVEMKKRYGEWAADFGITVDVMAAPTEKDLKSQLETLEAMVAKDYKAIIFTPIDPYNLVPGIVKANEKGIFMLDSGPSVNGEALKEAGGKLDGWISATFRDQGRLAAEEIVRILGDKGGKVAIIEGIPGAGQSEARKLGSSEVFNAAANVEIVAVEPGNWDRNKAYDITTNLLKVHPDISAIYCANDVMALAAADALEVAGKKDHVLIFGTDFIPEAKEAIKNGKLDGSTTFSQAAWTRGALTYSLKLIQGSTDLPEKLVIPITLVTKRNVAKFEGWK